VVPAPLDSSVLFHCKSGHEFELADLLRFQSMPVRRGLEDLLDQWSHQQAALLRTVQDARKHGHLEVADIFNRHAKSLECRIVKVRNAFAMSDSTKLIRVPDALRS
jgi:hypothetical protein